MSFPAGGAHAAAVNAATNARRRCVRAPSPSRIVAGTALAYAGWLLGCDATRTVAGDAALISLAVRVSPPASLAPAAARLGWPVDGVPGATVVLNPVTAATLAPDTAVADSLGIARFRNLAAGDYEVAASRTLTGDEIARAGDAVGGNTAFTGLITAELGDVDQQLVTLRLAPVDRGALLFSEFAPLALRTRGSTFYNFANYIRLYNNSDTTIALAEKLFFVAFPNWQDYSSVNPVNTCATFASLMRDPSGVWAQHIYRFPKDAKGLRPGEAALLVTDAIDHRPIGQGEPGFYDFSRVDFEFIGTSDVDNPVVLNIANVGPRLSDPDGHGWHGHETRPIYGLAQPLNLETLPKQYNAVWAAGSNFVRIPNAALLDLLSTTFAQLPPYPFCLPSILDALDAGIAGELPGEGPVSLHRRVARTLPDGRVILQRSRNSAADWFLGPMTPFVVP